MVRWDVYRKVGGDAWHDHRPAFSFGSGLSEGLALKGGRVLTMTRRWLLFMI